MVSQLREILTVVVLCHPFLFGKIPMQFQATSKGISGAVAGEDEVKIDSRSRANFWRCCRGDIINIYQVPNDKSHLLAIYIIFHLPLVFISPTSQKIAVLLPSFLFAVFSSDLFTMTQENTKLCDFSNTNNNDFISSLIAPPATSAESCGINTALLNLLMKDQFPVLLMKMSCPILTHSWNCAI